MGAEEEMKECNTQACPDPCVDHGHPCYSAAVKCKKITDTEFQCGECPRGMTGDGIECTAVAEVSTLSWDLWPSAGIWVVRTF